MILHCYSIGHYPNDANILPVVLVERWATFESSTPRQHIWTCSKCAVISRQSSRISQYGTEYESTLLRGDPVHRWQTTITADLKSKQLLLFASQRLFVPVNTVTAHLKSNQLLLIVCFTATVCHYKGKQQWNCLLFKELHLLALSLSA